MMISKNDNKLSIRADVNNKYSKLNFATPLFTAEQIYKIEKEWFDNGNKSYGLMQQAAWQISIWIDQHASLLSTGKLLKEDSFQQDSCTNDAYIRDLSNKGSNVNKANFKNKHVCIWVGASNNGGDGWLVAFYLSQLDYQVTVIEVGKASTSDATLAKSTAQSQKNIHIIDFATFSNNSNNFINEVTIFVDALFGVGLDRVPKGDYAQAIHCLNKWADDRQLPVVAIDVPSGLVVNTGLVFDDVAVKADITLCLVARKLGLHVKDGQDYTGSIVDIPLIPTVLNTKPIAQLYHSAHSVPKRLNNAHKGSFGEVLIIGGNQVNGSQGMGGATILAANSAFAVGAGKLTVACDKAFHASLIASLPNAMSIDLHDNQGVKRLIDQCDVLAIGMGLGRDKVSQNLFYDYLQAGMNSDIDMVIDADGLYHLATLTQQDTTLKSQLASYSQRHTICYTPHSGEVARLLDRSVKDVESDRVESLRQLFDDYQGSWLLKGNGSIVMTSQGTYVCNAGNAGMSTAGMGDVLSGMTAGLMAQSTLPKECRTLQQAVIVHALAGDKLAERVGEWALQASDMPHEIGQVMKHLTN